MVKNENESIDANNSSADFSEDLDSNGKILIAYFTVAENSEVDAISGWIDWGIK